MRINENTLHSLPTVKKSPVLSCPEVWGVPSSNRTWWWAVVGKKPLGLSMKSIFAFVMGVLLLAGCNHSPKKEKTRPPVPPQQVVVIPSFNGDSAYRYVAEQVAFGPRVPGSEAHKKCAAYLASNLERFGASVQQQAFQMRAYNGKILDGINIIGTINPEANRRILLSAHWDSRPYADQDSDEAKHRQPIDGANDGASGVGVLLECARAMQQTLPEVGVDIILFDLEDYGPPKDQPQKESDGEFWGLGSQYWANNPHVFDYRAVYGILLDMVGAQDAVFPMERFSLYYAPHIVKKVWSKAQNMGYESYFPQQEGTYINDDHLYVNKYANIPMIDIIHQDMASVNGTFFDHWHTMEDNITTIDKSTLRVVGEVLMAVIYE